MKKLLSNVLDVSLEYLERLPQKQVGQQKEYKELLSSICHELPNEGEPPETAIDKLMKSVEDGLVHSTSSRYFGFVIGGATPTSIAADWLTSVWDQNAQVFNSSPAAAIIEDVVSNWILDLLDLPENAGVGFVTGTQMANFTGLAIARNTVLKNWGWDYTSNGLQGAPLINVLCGESCHGTVHSAIRMVGLGQKNIRIIKSDKHGRMVPEDLKKICSHCNSPIIICAQAGNVNTGSFDPFSEISTIAKNHHAWLHIDGAFGSWARVSPNYRHLTEGLEKADSWTVDAHKWLNVPYDSGILIIKDRLAFQEFKTARCSYAGPTDTNKRDGSQRVPENSRRARGFVLYAALRNLGRSGVKSIIENCCDIAQLFAKELSKLPHSNILNEVVLNQVLCRFEPANVIDLDSFNNAIVTKVQELGICWLGTTHWDGKTALRLSISNWSTAKEDVLKSVDSIKQAYQIVHSQTTGES